MEAGHPWALLRDQTRTDGPRPVVTYVGPEGRTELSVLTLANNVAKAANLLRDEYDIEPGDTVRLALPVHWQTTVWLGALAATGAVAALGAGPVALTVGTAERLDGGMPALRVSRHPFGFPDTDPLPPGTAEAAAELRAASDVFSPYAEPALDDVALRVDEDEWTHRDLTAAAARTAADHGVRPGSRMLVAADELSADLVPLLLALPLLVAGSLVLAPPSEDLEAITTTERIDTRLA